MAYRTLSAIAALVAALFAVGIAVAAPAHAGCGDRYPDVEWRSTGQTDLLVVSATPSVGDGLGLRLADEAGAMARVLEEDFGSVPPLSLCVFGTEDGLDATGLVPEGQLLHAAVFNEDGTVYVNTLDSRLFAETNAFGLAYAVLWDVAARQGAAGYPEPLATVIGQWYLARAAGKLELHHSQMRGGAFFRDPSGQGIEATDWAWAAQPPVYSWNPQFQESPLSDMVQWAVDQHGVEVLSDPDPQRWAEIEKAWQDALRAEALQGASGGNDWLIGLTIFFGFIGLAGLVAWLNKRSKRRIREQARIRTQAETGATARTSAAASPATPRHD